MCFVVMSTAVPNVTRAYKVINRETRESPHVSFTKYLNGTEVEARALRSSGPAAVPVFVTEIGMCSHSGIYVYLTKPTAMLCYFAGWGDLTDPSGNFVLIEVEVDPNDFVASGVVSVTVEDRAYVATYKKVKVIGDVKPA